jgi:hypothetical protein
MVNFTPAPPPPPPMLLAKLHLYGAPSPAVIRPVMTLTTHLYPAPITSTSHTPPWRVQGRFTYITVYFSPTGAPNLVNYYNKYESNLRIEQSKYFLEQGRNHNVPLQASKQLHYRKL